MEETVLDPNTEYDWKIQCTGSMMKLEDRFNKEVHILIAKQPPTVKDNNSATTQTVASALREKSVSWLLELTIVLTSHSFMRWKKWIFHIIPQ